MRLLLLSLIGLLGPSLAAQAEPDYAALADRKSRDVEGRRHDEEQEHRKEEEQLEGWLQSIGRDDRHGLARRMRANAVLGRLRLPEKLIVVGACTNRLHEDGLCLE